MKQARDHTGERVWEIKLASGVTHIGTIEALRWCANVLVDAGNPDGGHLLQRLDDATYLHGFCKHRRERKRFVRRNELADQRAYIEELAKINARLKRLEDKCH